MQKIQPFSYAQAGEEKPEVWTDFLQSSFFISKTKCYSYNKKDAVVYLHCEHTQVTRTIKLLGRKYGC